MGLRFVVVVPSETPVRPSTQLDSPEWYSQEMSACPAKTPKMPKNAPVAASDRRTPPDARAPVSGAPTHWTRPLPAPQRALLVCGWLAVALGCRSAPPDPAETAEVPTSTPHSQSQPLSAEALPPDPNPAAPRRVPLVTSAAECALLHEGLVIDLAAPGAFERHGFRLVPQSAPSVIEHAGQAFVRLDQARQDVEFWLPETLTQVGAEIQVQGTSSERVVLDIDGRRLGTLTPNSGTVKIHGIRSRPWTLTRGRHTLTIRLSQKPGSPPGANLGWVRLGDSSRWKGGNVPLGLQQLEGEVTIEDDRRAAFILREGAALRCPLWLGHPGIRPIVSVATWGEGEAELEVRLHRAEGEVRTLGRLSLPSAKERKWQELDLPQLPFSSEFVELEFAALRARGGARVALGHPSLELPPGALRPLPRAAQAFLFALGGLSSRQEPPAARDHGLPVAAEFAAEAVWYPEYRTTSSSAQATIASLLTGLPPWHHGLVESRLSLARGVRPLAELVESAGGRTALFTGVPTSFPIFGFGRGFERVDDLSPTENRAATEPLELFRKWASARTPEHTSAFALVHLRGAHPPFDISKDIAQTLAPPEYGGDLDARRAAIQLGSVRSRQPKNRKLPDEDWTRLDALAKAALRLQNDALSSTFDLLRRENLWDSSLIVVTGDTGSGARPEIPFDEHAPPTEAYLSVPLLIKFPHGEFGGTHAQGLFSPEDVFETVRASLGLPEGASAAEGLVLWPGSSPSDLAIGRPHVAYRAGRYATRLGPYLLSGQEGSAPNLCRIDWDPACADNRSAKEPLVAALLWEKTFEVLSRALAEPPSPERKLELDERTKNALFVWGHLE